MSQTTALTIHGPDGARNVEFTATEHRDPAGRRLHVNHAEALVAAEHDGVIVFVGGIDEGGAFSGQWPDYGDEPDAETRVSWLRALGALRVPSWATDEQRRQTVGI